MEKRNTLLLTVIAVATLLVAVVGATFAYFASNQDDYANGNIILTTNTAGTASVFDATGGALEMDITEDDMILANNSTTTAVKSDTDDIVVHFLSGTDDYAMTCTYDIVFAWDEDSDVYAAHTTDNATAQNREFTIQVVRDPSSTDTGALGTNRASSEVEIFTAKGANGIVVDDAKIKNDSESTATTHTWTLTTKFYNLPTNQKELANKHFSGKFSVANVSCVHDS